MGALVAAAVMAMALAAVSHFRDESRIRHQRAELSSMLARKDSRFEHVYVYGDPEGHVRLCGRVRDAEDAAELKSQMVARLGQEVGRTAHFDVIVWDDYIGQMERMAAMIEGVFGPLEPRVYIHLIPHRHDFGLGRSEFHGRGLSKTIYGYVYVTDCSIELTADEIKELRALATTRPTQAK